MAGNSPIYNHPLASCKVVSGSYFQGVGAEPMAGQPAAMLPFMVGA